MEYRYNPKDGSFYSFANSTNAMLAFLGPLKEWSDEAKEYETAEDFVFLCEMGITPDLIVTKEK